LILVSIQPSEIFHNIIGKFVMEKKRGVSVTHLFVNRYMF
jgi:hypothetical protein